MGVVRVGTRGSQLALTQTRQLVDALVAAHPGTRFELVAIRTTGDARQDVPFTAVGTKGMFVKEIEEALLAADVDVAVHSMKDLPGELAPGLTLGAVPRRADARDALLSRGEPLAALRPGAVVGTSSTRRQAQIRAFRPDLDVQELRGNLDTRVRRLDEGRYDAIVLACAGLERMGWADRIVERIPAEVSVPAPGQGALAVECRAGDAAALALLRPVHDEPTGVAAAAERAFQAALGAGCTVPAGAYATLSDDGALRLVAIVAAPDGSRVLRAERAGTPSQAAEIGASAAAELLARGADRYLADAYG